MAIDSTHAHGMRVLLVDDDPDDFVLTESLLRTAFNDQIRVDWEDTVDGALQKARDVDYDIVLTDYYLGTRTGTDLARALRDQEACSAPVLILTGRDCAEADADSLDAGISGYLVKQSLTPSALERAVRYSREHGRREQDLRDVASRDPVTGSVNRRGFMERVHRAIARSQRNEEHIALLMIDLDDFKSINDTYGHPVGDQLLQAISARLHERVRQTDTVARLGGDEFVVMVTQLHGPADAGSCAHKLLSVFEAPFEIGELRVAVKASVGISLFPFDGTTADNLIDKADAALYQAKHKGKGGYALYDPRQDTAVHAKGRLRDDLARAIEEELIDVHFQPILDTRSGELRGTEALARWEDPLRGWVPPGVFVREAEKCGLIHSLGELVLNRACERILELRKTPSALPLAINVSGKQVNRRGFVDSLEEALARWEVSPNELELELTESVLLECSEVTDRFYARMKALGIRLSIDDFGSGYSSLGYLQRIPATRIKIGRQVTGQHLEDPATGVKVMRAIVELGKALEREVVIEGIETPKQWWAARHSGCQLIQGFLVTSPLPFPQYLEWVRRHLQQRSEGRAWAPAPIVEGPATDGPAAEAG